MLDPGFGGRPELTITVSGIDFFIEVYHSCLSILELEMIWVLI